MSDQVRNPEDRFSHNDAHIFQDQMSGERFSAIGPLVIIELGLFAFFWFLTVSDLLRVVTVALNRFLATQ